MEDIAGNRVLDYGSMIINVAVTLSVPSDVAAGVYILKAASTTSTQIIRLIKQ